MLWLSIYLPLLPLQVFNQSLSTDKPLVVVQEQTVLLCNQAASQQGIEPGLKLNTARGLTDTLFIAERNREKEQALQQYLAESVYQFSSSVSCYQNQRDESSLLLEIGGSLRLFNGPDNLQNQVRQLLKTHPLAKQSSDSNNDNEGFQHQLSIANTPKSAELFARYFYSQQQNQHHKQQYGQGHTQRHQHKAAHKNDTLDAIPTQLLDIPEKSIQQCLNMGLTQLGDLLTLPKAALAKRFNHHLIHYLDQLSGKQADPQRLITLPNYFEREQFYIDGLRSHADLLYPIEKLLKEFCTYLQMRQLKSRGVEWVFQRFSRNKNHITISCSEPLNQYETLLALIKIKLDTIPLDSPVETVTLRATAFETITFNEADFFYNNQKTHSAHLLADKLVAKLGPQALTKMTIDNHHFPEISNRSYTINHPTDKQQTKKTVQNSQKSSSEKQDKFPPRPAWLLAKPEQLRSIEKSIYYKNNLLTILKGPERIEGNWWNKASSRDYFIATQQRSTTAATNNHTDITARNRLTYQAFYWIYYDRKAQQWYLHGLFS